MVYVDPRSGRPAAVAVERLGATTVPVAKPRPPPQHRTPPPIPQPLQPATALPAPSATAAADARIPGHRPRLLLKQPPAALGSPPGDDPPPGDDDPTLFIPGHSSNGHTWPIYRDSRASEWCLLGAAWGAPAARAARSDGKPGVALLPRP